MLAFVSCPHSTTDLSTQTLPLPAFVSKVLSNMDGPFQEAYADRRDDAVDNTRFTDLFANVGNAQPRRAPYPVHGDRTDTGHFWSANMYNSAALICAAMAVVHLNYDLASVEFQDLKRLYRDILYPGEHRTGLGAGIVLAADDDDDDDDAYVVVSTIPDVLRAAASVLKTDNPRHIISAAMLAHTAAEVSNIRLGDTYTAHIQHPPKNTAQFVAKAIEQSNVAYREFFDAAVMVVEGLAECYLNLDALVRAEVELMVRAHVALDAFSLALSERVAAELVLAYAQITKESPNVTIDTRVCDLLSSNPVTHRTSERQKPIENPPEPSCDINQLRAGGMLAALAANAAQKENDRTYNDNTAGRESATPPWLAEDLKRIDVYLISKYMSSAECQQAGAALDDTNNEHENTTSTKTKKTLPVSFGKHLKMECTKIVVRLCDEIVGVGPNVDPTRASVRLFVAIFNDVPCLLGPGSSDDSSKLTIFEAAFAASTELNKTAAPRHSAIAAVTTVLALLGPAMLTPRPSSLIREHAVADVANDVVAQVHFDLDDVFQVIGGPIDASATVGTIRSKYASLGSVNATRPPPSLVGGTHKYLEQDLAVKFTPFLEDRAQALFSRYGKGQQDRPLLRATNGFVSIATRQPLSNDTKAGRTIAAFNYHTLLIVGGVLALNNDIESAPLPRPSGCGQTSIAVVVRKMHIGAGEVFFKASTNTTFEDDVIKFLKSQDECISKINSASTLLQGCFQELIANAFMHTCKFVYDKLYDNTYNFISPDRVRTTTGLPTHATLSTLLLENANNVLDEACTHLSIGSVHEKGLGEVLARQVISLATNRSVRCFANMCRVLLDDNSNISKRQSDACPSSVAGASTKKRKKPVASAPEASAEAMTDCAFVSLIQKHTKAVVAACNRASKAIDGCQVDFLAPPVQAAFREASHSLARCGTLFELAEQPMPETLLDQLGVFPDFEAVGSTSDTINGLNTSAFSSEADHTLDEFSGDVYGKWLDELEALGQK